MSPRILLVRHGRSAHVHAGWIDAGGFRRWREAYEAAGILAGELPPPALATAAAESGVVVASDTPRAIESARLLAPGREVTVSPLLRELDLLPANPGIRLPLFGWALAVGLRSLMARGHATPAERARAVEAAEWLAALAGKHGSVIAVTHATFRSVLGRTLVTKGWQRDGRRERRAHWSGWSYSRGG